MTDPSTNERRPPLHLTEPAHRRAPWWLAAIVGFVALLLAIPAVGHAEEPNANNYNCIGKVAAGEPEAGNEEQQVQYSFYCNGPITGYQVQSQIPVTGVQGQPSLISNATSKPLSDSFSCSGEFPGFAANCVGLAKQGYETITGQVSIGTKLCAEPRIDPLLTVTYAYLEKGVVTQAISGPFDLGRPAGCKADAYSGYSRFNPKPASTGHKKKSAKKGKKSEKK
jgi:hypothetical protein